MTHPSGKPIWPCWCLIACLIAAGAVSSRALDRETPGRGAGETTAEQTDRQEPGTEAAAVRRIAPHDEVCRLPEGGTTVVALPPLVATRRSPPHTSASHTTASSPAAAYPDTRLLPVELTAVEAKASDDASAAEHDWPEPEALLERLDELAAVEATAAWATETARLVREVGPVVVGGSDQATVILGQLRQQAAEGTALAVDLDDKALSRRLCRAGYALGRRLDVWEELARLGQWGPIPAEIRRPDPRRLSRCLAEIERITGDSAQGRAWREYLLVDALRQWSGRDTREDRHARVLARRVLKRLMRVSMSMRQRQFVGSGPVAALKRELQRLAAEPVEPAELLGHLERYEKTARASDARRLATDRLYLGLTCGGGRCPLAERLEGDYRNANLRVAVTEEFLGRLMPDQEPEYAPVRETVLGNPVRGRSLTSTRVGVRMLPDPNRVRLALEITGEVASLTSSTSGPATFFNNSMSTYTARKPLEIDLQGIHLSPAEVEVQSDTRLRGLETDFDGIPLIGLLVSRIARSQHEQKQPAVTGEVRQKVARRARQRIDSEADARLGEFSQRLQQKVLAPLRASRLDPKIIDAETTDRRLTIRVRLAGEDQLGGHTPRPRAPSDSLASLQVHETTLNNVLDRLALDGRTFTLPELSRHVATQLNCDPPWEDDPAHKDVSITFAERDAVRVCLSEGRVGLTLAIARLSRPPRHWRDFTVEVFYRPRVHGRSVRLARDGVIQLSGQDIAMGAQIALRGIFAKTFSKRRAWSLVPDRLASNEKLADLAVTQFVIEDGWVGIALGPKRPAVRTARQR